ncbi:MAG: hypothetical protein LBC86_09700 [Oscillospiraceae bacterium]|jgi:hypothetical protein|nr:hypothetical protein [Oscillospiraceae bacterium]
MAKNKSGRAEKIKKREEAKKKEKQKKITVTCSCILASVVLAAFIVLLYGRQDRAEILAEYSDGVQTVRLFEDGRFSASLPHNMFKNGTYTISTADNVTTITFNASSGTETALIQNDALHLPAGWDDGCGGHGYVLPKT